MGYVLVLDDDDDDEEVVEVNVFKKDRKWKYLRRKIEILSLDDDFFQGDDGLKGVSKDSDLDEWEKEERERRKDLEERDVFVDRFK